MAFNPFKAIGNAIGRAVSAVRDVFTPAPTRAPERPSAPAPEPRVEPTPPPERPSAPAPERAPRMPKFASEKSNASNQSRDERAFGADSTMERNLNEAVSDFIADRGGLGGLSSDARDWLQHSSVSSIFDKYWTSGGFSSDQVLKGMTSVHNIHISERPDGSLAVEFDYDADVDGYEVHGHASA